MLLVRLGRSSMAVNPGSRLKIFGQIENIFTSTAMLIQSASFFEFQRDTEKHAKILANRALRREIKRILDIDRPYSAPAGLLKPKPEPVNEEPLFPHEFMYRRKGIFDESSG